MHRIAIRALAICCLAPAAAAAPRAAEAVVRLSWRGDLAVRCEIPLGAALLRLGCEADAKGPVLLVAGLDSPLVRLGPLAAAGLLREAGDPLGFGPGTTVGDEETGLRLDGSLHAAGGWSAEIMPVPGSFGLFWMDAGGSHVLGCRCAWGRRGPLELDAAAAVGGRAPADAPASWVVEHPTAAAGRTLHGAARIVARGSGWSATVSGGMSAAERAPPGLFVLATASFRQREVGVDLLAAGASAGYLELGRTAHPGGAKAGVRLQLAGEQGSVRAGYVMSAELPGFVPGPFLPTEEELSFTVERSRPGRGGEWQAGLSASNRIVTAADGARTDAPSGRVSVGWNSPRMDAGVELELDRDEGIAAELSVEAAARGVRAGGELACSWQWDGPPLLSISAFTRFDLGSAETLLEAGVRGARLRAGGLDGCEPWGSLEWRVRQSGDGSR